MIAVEICGLREDTQLAIRSVLARYPEVQRALLYGSRAMKTFQQGSDIDITLVGPDLTVNQLLRIANDIDDLLLPYKVDLSLHHALDHSGLLAHIDRVGLEFYRH